MIKLFLIFVVFYATLILVRNKIIIRFDTFLRKGFKKMHDKYGVYCWVR